MGKKVTSTNNLAVAFPNIAKEWDQEKNSLTPSDVAPASNKKYWFRCEESHSYSGTVVNRTYGGNGCPYCSGNKASSTNNLLVRFPEISKEWDSAKNGAITPKDVLHGSQKKYWFLCGRGHSYYVRLNDRTSGKGCHFCSGRKVCGDNSLEARFPDVAKEWDFNKNGKITPRDVLPKSNKKYWFKCEKDHSYLVQLNSRTTMGSGCPNCLYKTQEKVRIIFERIFQTEFKGSRPKFLGRLSLDGYSDKLKLAFEYDGEFHDKAHHKSKNPDADLKNQKLRDTKKNKLCLENGITLIRISYVNKNNLEETIALELMTRGLITYRNNTSPS